MPEDRMNKEFDRVPPPGSKYSWLTQHNYLNGGGPTKPKSWFYSTALGKKNGTYAMYYELKSMIPDSDVKSDCPDAKRAKRVTLESRNSDINRYILIARQLPTLQSILADIARKATHDVRILIEYGSVSGGLGQTLRADENVATEGKLDIQDVGWDAFQGIKLDRCTEIHLVKLVRVKNQKAEILTILHEIVAHIANSYMHWVSGYKAEHNRWGTAIGNPYYERMIGAGNGETPTAGSPAEALMRELDLVVK